MVNSTARDREEFSYSTKGILSTTAQQSEVVNWAKGLTATTIDNIFEDFLKDELYSDPFPTATEGFKRRTGQNFAKEHHKNIT
jgi:hypothetical protein